MGPIGGNEWRCDGRDASQPAAALQPPAVPRVRRAPRRCSPSSVKAVDDIAGRRRQPAAASPDVSDIVDLTDALTLAALPTAYLLKIEITPRTGWSCIVPRAEVGQGITTAMGIVAAEELDARLETVDVVLDDARPELLWNQLTGGSNSVHSLYTPMRTVAAAARARLVTAAAQRFGVAASTLDDARLARWSRPTAAPRPTARCRPRPRRSPCRRCPATPKDPSQFTLIGQPTTRLDARDIVTGQRRSTRSISPSPARADRRRRARRRSAARSLTFDDDRGARDARRARHRAHPDRRRGRRGDLRSGAGRARRAADHLEPGPERRALRRADPRQARRRPRRRSSRRRSAASSITREFDFAFAPHAPLEVHTCVADVRRDSAEIWYGAKSPIVASQQVAAAIGLPGRQGHAARRARRRLVRPPPVLRARDRGRADLEGARPPGQADVDAQRRHAPRPDAPREPPQGARHLRCSATCSPTSTGTRRCPSTSRTVSARRSARSGSAS